MSSALHGYATACSDGVYEWSSRHGWNPVGPPAEQPRTITARIAASDLTDLHPIVSCLTLASDLRLFVQADPSDGAVARLAVKRAAAFLSDHGAALFWVDDLLQTWQRTDRSQDITEGALYACVGFSPLAIAAVAHNGDLGGASRAHIEMAAELLRRGHLVHTFTPGWSARTLPTALRGIGVATSDHHCHWWASSEPDRDWTSSGTGVTELTSRLVEINPDIVITETSVIPGGALAARDAAIPHIWMVHERIDPGYGLHAPCPPADLGAAIDELSDAVVVNSRFVAEYFFTDAEKRRVVAPISLFEFDRLVESRALADAAKDPLAAPPNRPITLAIIGQVAEAKGHLDLLEAVSILADEGHRVRVRVFGTGDPEAMSNLRRAIAGHGLGDDFILEGHRPDALEALRNCDAVAMPSWAEAFGRVPVEAVAAGCPVLYASAGGMTEFMVDGVSGLAFEARNPAALAAAIRQLEDGDLRERLVTGGRTQLRDWLERHDAATAIVELAQGILLRHASPATWWESARVDLRRADAADCGLRLRSLPRWHQAGLHPSLAVFQGSRTRNLSLHRQIDNLAGSAGSRHRRMFTAAARVAAMGAFARGDRLRAGLLLVGEDPLLDPGVVDGMLDRAWYRDVHDVPRDTDALLHFAQFGLRAGAAPNEFIRPAWYLDRNSDVAFAGIGAVRHYLTMGCFEGRAPGPDFDPERYLSENPDVMSSQMPPLVHYLRYGRTEGRRLW